MKKIKKWFRKRRQLKDRKKMDLAKSLIQKIQRLERVQLSDDKFDSVAKFFLKLQFARVEKYFEKRIKKFVRKHNIKRPDHGKYNFETYDYILAWRDHLIRRV